MRNVDRIARKVDQTKRVGPAPVVEGKGAKVGVLAYGTTHWAVVESRDQLRAEKGLATDYCRVRSFPFSEDVRAFVAAHERVYVVEQNRDAQMLAMLRIEYPDLAPRMRAVRVYNGLPADARSLTDEIARQESAAGTGAR